MYCLSHFKLITIFRIFQPEQTLIRIDDAVYRNILIGRASFQSWQNKCHYPVNPGIYLTSCQLCLKLLNAQLYDRKCIIICVGRIRKALL